MRSSAHFDENIFIFVHGHRCPGWALIGWNSLSWDLNSDHYGYPSGARGPGILVGIWWQSGCPVGSWATSREWVYGLMGLHEWMGYQF
mmetsp:Transcript_29481/g.62645  ORF Transcript_29481/g.62645 Transcript_29481/m.62645 type:complete len:88 (+) Transcript_29481:48-311(+)